jgi:hypothetical protein
MPRRFPIVQFPNRTLILAMLAGVVAQAADDPVRRVAGIGSRALMLVWAAREIRSGANWFRRLLGVGVGAQHARALARTLQPDE